MIDVRVPELGESITEAAVARWHKQQNEWVNQDELLLELETDKVTLEVTAPTSGKVSSIKAQVNDYVKIGDIIAQIDDAAANDADAAPVKKAEAPPPPPPQKNETPAPASEPAPQENAAPKKPLSPSVRRLVEEYGIDVTKIKATGRRQSITKGDVLSYIERNNLTKQKNVTPSEDTPKEIPSSPPTNSGAQQAAPAPTSTSTLSSFSNEDRPVERKPLSRLRKTIAKRLKEAQNTAAILTTFNEVDVTSIIELRAEYQEDFQRLHGIKLGFMPFFVRACVSALKKFPDVNSRIEGDEILSPSFCDVGVAVGTESGLVVPILRNTEDMSFVDIEKSISDFAVRARDNKLKPNEMMGGTFTISNGGVYGSMLSTPILSPPQSAILGMHNIQKRPVVMEDDTIVPLHMMYLALSYDHRLIDGKGAVSFLVHIKSVLENPEKLLLGL